MTGEEKAEQDEREEIAIRFSEVYWDIDEMTEDLETAAENALIRAINYDNGDCMKEVLDKAIEDRDKLKDDLRIAIYEAIQEASR